jgi:hypothetical protein
MRKIGDQARLIGTTCQRQGCIDRLLPQANLTIISLCMGSCSFKLTASTTPNNSINSRDEFKDNSVNLVQSGKNSNDIGTWISEFLGQDAT